MLAAPSGAAGFFARHPVAVLSAIALPAGLATAAASVSAWLLHASPLDIAAFAAAVVLVVMVAYWHTRHGALALLIAMTPLPGLIWVAPLASGSQFFLVPYAAYGFAAALASLYAQHLLDCVLGGSDGEGPWRAAAAVLVLTGGLAALWFSGTGNGNAALQAGADTFAAVASLMLLLPLTVRLLRFEEATVTRINRVRERRARLAEPLGGGAVPRWSLALTGIILIFAAMGWFGFPHPLGVSWWRIAVSGLVVLGVFGIIGGGWREAIALAAVAAMTGLVALWWRAYDPRLSHGAVDVLALAALASLSGLVLARRLWAWRRGGDSGDMLCRQALEECSGAVFAALAALAAVLPGLLFAGAVPFVLLTPLAVLAGALLFPAVLTALETLLPRRRSVDEVFGRKEPKPSTLRRW
jgi:hypothetical protein